MPWGCGLNTPAATAPLPGIPAPLRWLAAFSDPQVMLAWSEPAWEGHIRLARRLRLLGRLGETAAAAGVLAQIPAAARRHLIAERRYAAWRTLQLSWSLARLGQTLGQSDHPLVLLKGAAYIGQNLAVGRGRLPSDIDILVPRAHIEAAQQRLIAAGWQETKQDPHDQRYYREWSHELPPMQHPAHGLELDLHHNILPPVARVRVDAGRLLEGLQPSALPGWQVLHPTAQVLHAAAHLFHDADLQDRVRDLVDLDGLLRHFGSEAGMPGFWPELARRAEALGLSESLSLALHFCRGWLGTPIPADIWRQAGPGRLGPWQRTWLLPALGAALHPCASDRMPSLAQRAGLTLLATRYHLHRLPLPLLLPHLVNKARRRLAQQPSADAA